MSFVVAAGFVLAIWLGVLILFLIFRSPSADQLQLFRRRLRDYSVMKGARYYTITQYNANIVLRPKEHEILLGILKKVEAKNGVMATIWSLIYVSLVAIAIASYFDTDCDIDKGHILALSIAALIFGVPFLISAIFGARQLDNFSDRC